MVSSAKKMLWAFILIIYTIHHFKVICKTYFSIFRDFLSTERKHTNFLKLLLTEVGICVKGIMA